MASTIAITGSTGHLGRRVLDQLSDRSPVLLVRDAGRAPRVAGCEVREAEYRDYESCRAALAGVDTVLMVSAHETARRREDHRRFVTAAEDAGVRHVVYTSFQGAAPDATFTLARDHAHTEQVLRAGGLSWTFLRNSFYADLLPHFAGRDGVIRGPAGSGRVAAVARADVADAAAAVLRDPEAHAKAAYTLTGPEALSFPEIAARAGAALGRDLRFEDETLEEAYASRRAAYDAEQWQLDAWVSTYAAIADGSCAEVTGDVERLTGRQARTLEQALTQPHDPALA